MSELKLQKKMFERHRSLLEFSRDMDRNAVDYSFVRQHTDAKIHYVFDENIFEFYIGAHNQTKIESAYGDTTYWDKRNYSSFFHKKAWRPSNDPGYDKENARSINRQIAIVTSELLFSGLLVGQMDREIHMTQWHWNELVTRTEILYEYFSKAAGRNYPKKKVSISSWLDSVNSVKELANQYKDDADSFRNSPNISSILASDPNLSDLSNLFQKFRNGIISNRAFVKYSTGRILASLLASDSHIVALWQIWEYWKSDDFLSRLQPVMKIGDLPPSNVLSGLSEEWIKRIEKEQDRRGQIYRRSKNSIRSDALSLSQVQWISKNLKNNETIAFVTGDDLVFDAYRRWWVDNHEEEFILRRASQFVPMMNFDATNSMVSSSSDLFDRVQMAIEPALIYFNLGRGSYLENIDRQNSPAKQASSVRYNSGREHFALLLKDDEFNESEPFAAFTSFSKDRTTKENLNLYSELRADFQQLEKDAIGVNADLIAIRVRNQTMKKLEIALENDSSFLEYLKDEYQDVYQLGARHFIPETLEILQVWLGERKSNYSRRVPLALDLKLPKPAEGTLREHTSDIVKFVDLLFDGQSKKASLMRVLREPWIFEEPSLVFAAIAIVALRLSLWSDAVKYSGVAKRAAARTIILKEESQENLKRRENNIRALDYLHAISKRFEIGSIAIESKAGLNRVSNTVTSALNLLEATYTTENLAGKNQTRNSVYRARAESEAIACVLFKASYVIRQVDETLVDDRELILNECFSFIEEKYNILMPVLNNLEYEVNKENRSTTRRIFEAIKLQVYCNFAAFLSINKLSSYVCNKKITSNRIFNTDLDYLKKYLMEVQESSEFRNLPLIVQVEICILLGKKSETKLQTILNNKELINRRGEGYFVDVGLYNLYSNFFSST